LYVQGNPEEDLKDYAIIDSGCSGSMTGCSGMKGNDLKTYVRRFQELATLCPTMVPDSKKMMEVFIGGLPRSIEGNVTASKPQTYLKSPIHTHMEI
ncbi:hypothetical protein Tco_0357854, partial [Tanacetum coccineum]